MLLGFIKELKKAAIVTKILHEKLRIEFIPHFYHPSKNPYHPLSKMNRSSEMAIYGPSLFYISDIFMNKDLVITPVQKERDQIFKVFIMNHFPADSDLIGEIGAKEIDSLNTYCKGLTLKN